MNEQVDARIESERRFHNERFSVDHGRREQAKYYFALQNWKADTEASVLSHARGADALEYGSGVGDFTFELLSRGGFKSVAGIDISEVAVEHANRRAAEAGAGHVRFAVMDAHNLQFADNSFDLVYGNGILHHLDTRKSLEQIARVLRPGGVAVFSEPLGTNPVYNFYRRMTPGARTEDEHPFTGRDLAICRSLFARVTVRYYGFFSLGAVPFARKRFGKPLLALLQRMDALLFKLPLAWRLSWMSLIELRR